MSKNSAAELSSLVGGCRTEKLEELARLQDGVQGASEDCKEEGRRGFFS